MILEQLYTCAVAAILILVRTRCHLPGMAACAFLCFFRHTPLVTAIPFGYLYFYWFSAVTIPLQVVSVRFHCVSYLRFCRSFLFVLQLIMILTFTLYGSLLPINTAAFLLRLYSLVSSVLFLRTVAGPFAPYVCSTMPAPAFIARYIQRAPHLRCGLPATCRRRTAPPLPAAAAVAFSTCHLPLLLHTGWNYDTVRLITLPYFEHCSIACHI